MRWQCAAVLEAPGSQPALMQTLSVRCLQGMTDIVNLQRTLPHTVQTIVHCKCTDLLDCDGICISILHMICSEGLTRGYTVHSDSLRP